MKVKLRSSVLSSTIAAISAISCKVSLSAECDAAGLIGGTDIAIENSTDQSVKVFYGGSSELTSLKSAVEIPTGVAVPIPFIESKFIAVGTALPNKEPFFYVYEVSCNSRYEVLYNDELNRFEIHEVR